MPSLTDTIDARPATGPRILFVYGMSEWAEPWFEMAFSNLRARGVRLTVINARNYLKNPVALTPFQLHQKWLFKDPALMALYAEVRRQIPEHDVLIEAMENVFHPDFLNSIEGSIYRVMWTGDDPDSSGDRSFPYVRFFDHAFTMTVNYNEDERIVDKFREWGAPRADVWLYGALPPTYDPPLTVEQVRVGTRSHDVVFVGQPFNRADKLKKLKKTFGPRLHLFGRGWGWRTAVQHRIWARKLPWGGLPTLYSDSKIGINMHISYGIGNARMFQLPMNGVLLLSDNAAWLKEIYEPGREAVSYDGTDDLIAKIEHYLQHDDERRAIAAAGFQRARANYRFEDLFEAAVAKIQFAMARAGFDGARNAAVVAPQKGAP